MWEGVARTEYAVGTVVALHHSECNSAVVHPYRIRLIREGTFVYAPQDVDAFVKPLDDGTPEAAAAARNVTSALWVSYGY